MKNFNPVRGTYDYLPEEARVREIVRERILKNYLNNGYNLIGTPILESLDFLNSSEGGDNLRLIFKTIKRGEKLDLTKENLTENDIAEEGLRYDLTVPLARFYCNNRDKLPTPFKSIQIDNSFRAERPQRGRNRQFVQCDIDVLGDKTINAELELLKTAIDTYNDLGFKDLIVKINHRNILTKLILNAGFGEVDVNSVCVTLDKIDKISLQGVMMELIEKGFDTENINNLTNAVQTILEKGIDSCVDFGAEEQDVADIKFLIDTLRMLTTNTNCIKFDISIVRGQGYYTGAVYEVYTEGFSGAIGGGGRYDKMIGKFSGTDTCAVGISIGFEPICMLVRERGYTYDSKQNLALVYDEQDDMVEVFKLKEELKSDYNVSLYLKAKNMRAFYEKITAVADFVAIFKDYKDRKEIKKLTKE